jgi:acyl dehydratase
VSVRNATYESFSVGEKSVRAYRITAEVYSHFLAAFDDRSPIHVDEEYARSRGFAGRVMHGAILNGFLSHFVGVHFGGRQALLLAVDLRYSSPSYIDDVLEIRATITQKADAVRVVVVRLEIFNVARGELAAAGRAQIRFD